jgi:hypothetical protein
VSYAQILKTRATTIDARPEWQANLAGQPISPVSETTA